MNSSRLPSGINRFVTGDSSRDENLKRLHSSESDNEDDVKQLKTSEVHIPTPLFLTVKHADESLSLSRVSPFVVNKAFVAEGGSPAAIRKLRNGTILVEAINENQARKYLKMKGFFDQAAVVVEPHPTLNSSKGIVFSRELVDCSVEELKEELKNELVTDVVRITRFENNVQTPTTGIILTFASPNAPKKIKAGYLSLSVRPYFRNPQRCFKCQKFGHSSKGCAGPEICSRCSVTGHDGKECTNEEHCANCKGEHQASSKNCRVYIEETDILKIATIEKLSFADAKKEYRRRSALPVGAPSFSQVVAKPTQALQCSSCTVLEGMVRALTDQVTALVNQLSALTGSKAPAVPQPQNSNPSMQATHQTATKTSGVQRANTTATSSLYLKERKQLTPNERKIVADKLRANIKSKEANRQKSNKSPPQSSRSSQVSIETDMIVDDSLLQTDFQTTTGKFNLVGKKNKITFNK